jgi:hypothetical protein
MPQMKKLLLTMLFAVLMANCAMAFEVTAPTQTFVVPMRTSTQIDVVVKSDLPDTISANIIDAKAWTTMNASQQMFSAGEEKTFNIYLSPMEDTFPGLYKISVLFESIATHELKKADIYAFVTKANILIIERITVTGDLQPTGSAKVSAVVTNLKTVTVQGAEVTTDVFSPTKKIASSVKIVPRLDPGADYSVETLVPIAEHAEPGAYSVDVRLASQNETAEAHQTFFVQSKAMITRSESRTSLLFGYSKKFTITNDGNTVGETTVTDSVSKFDSLFFSGSTPTSTGSEYAWFVQGIQPGDIRVVQYEVDYTPLFIFIAALAILVWVYFTRFRTIRVKKYIIQKKYITEGEEFTVAVEIANTLGKTVDVEVQDFVPAVFDVKDADGPKPTKKKGHVGAELSWSTKGIHNGESRIFTYKIVPIFGVRGSIRLPKASAIFSAAGHTWEAKSFPATVGVSEVPAEDQLWNKFFRRKK